MKSYINILATALFVSCFGLSCFAVCPSMDFTGDCRVDFNDFAIIAEQWQVNYDSNDIAAMALEWLTEGIQPIAIVWVSINEPGFNGQMSKYETTNALYCQFLNAALASGDITVNGNNVLGANGTNSGADFAGQVYYNLAGAGDTWNGATNGGAARINYSGSAFTVNSEFENHPVTYVSWYGATAFCNYYSYRLPTEWKWQAVADYDGRFAYGCGTTINNSMANYYDSTHPYGTTIVGAFGTYGYGMCDMAGNVWEWTSTVFGNYCVLRGGGWGYIGDYCTVSYWGINKPYESSGYAGFRVCPGAVVPNVTGMTLAEAEVSINAASLVIGIITRDYNDTIPSGSVISSAPAAGSTVDIDSSVDLLISRGHNIFEPANMVWVNINEPGFNGQMSKYETTNAQYCQYLNVVKNSNLITVHNNKVYAASDTSHSQPYYDLAGAGYTGDGATNGGAARINYTGSSFTVDRGFENYPVTYVSWYGATAFCNYCGYLLPTEWEWQAVADYTGSYTYGCGTTITNSKANYYGSAHPDGTTAVGSFGTYGYGICDMAGNVEEWTSSHSGSYPIIRGGCWNYYGFYCTVSFSIYNYPTYMYRQVGFRACR
jgi:formylglycine-generating enzyme required for sulfatase activity